jgi:hypothetical protein
MRKAILSILFSGFLLPILAQNIVVDSPVQFINLASELGYEFTLIDGLWDKQIGRNRMEDLAKYAKLRNVSLCLWYNSNGYWNDACG